MASMHALPAAHALATAHCGADSPGVTQKPSSQMLATMHEQQSELVAHLLRHTAFTHSWPFAQSELAKQPGVGP
jgi:hypothetical protein